MAFNAWPNMAASRAFGQTQSASPWSSGAPPGLQQQQQQQQGQQMFQQPMGAFDISGAWQGQPQVAQQMVAAMPQVQFVANPAAFMQPQMRQQQHMQQNQQQRPMHQRSLSAPRIGVNGPNKRGFMNQNNNSNNNFAGGQQQQWQNNNNNRQPNQQRATRQQSRNISNNNNNNSNNQSNNQRGQFNNNSNFQNNKPQQQQQQQNRQQQQTTRPNTRFNNNNSNNNNNNTGTKPAGNAGSTAVVGKVNKLNKQNALKAKQSVKPPAPADRNNNKLKKVIANKTTPNSTSNQQPAKGQSKTAERKQLKLQARKNAESLNKSSLPVVKANKASTDVAAVDGEQKSNPDEPIDQAQLKCVPAVFGFVCKLCDVFLKDKVARREHIDSDDRMEKFNVFVKEEEEAKEAAAKAANESESVEMTEQNDTEPAPVTDDVTSSEANASVEATKTESAEADGKDDEANEEVDNQD